MLTNKILSRLPDAEFARLMPLLEPGSLSAGEQLADPEQAARFIYFPESAVISCHADMQDGNSAEVAMIGREGIAGIPALFNSRPQTHSLNVIIGGSALRMKKAEFERELDHAGSLRQSVLAYAGEYMTQISQRAACNILHLTEQRFANWLLLLTERLGTDIVFIMQDRIAWHLGVRRAGISVIIAEFQKRGIINYTRGSLYIINRQLLEAATCECNAVISAQGPTRVIN